jgi:hypothetical protein
MPPVPSVRGDQVVRALEKAGFKVARVMGLSENYVATLRQRALREGSAGLVRPSGPKPKLGPADWARARRWREARASEAEIAARLGVAQSTVSRRLGGRSSGCRGTRVRSARERLGR